jgi:hypothetical protein
MRPFVFHGVLKPAIIRHAALNDNWSLRGPHRACSRSDLDQDTRFGQKQEHEEDNQAAIPSS